MRTTLTLIITIFYAYSAKTQLSFVSISSPFPATSYGAVKFFDMDGDGDQDVLITGGNGGISSASTKLFENDGTGNFTEITSTSFIAARRSSIAIADVDNDNDIDVIIIGADSTNTTLPVTLYLNDGNGDFSIAPGSSFVGVSSGSVEFADVDNDNDQDLLITGYVSSTQYISQLFLNAGDGTFSLAVGTPFTGVFWSSTAFADIDNDNDLDLLITGAFLGNAFIANLYENDGMGNFTLITGTPFVRVKLGSVAFSDIDNDNDLDLLITGADSTLVRQAVFYENDGNGNFTELLSSALIGVTESEVAFADVDNDNDDDLLITGNSASGVSSILYENIGSGVFSVYAGISLEGYKQALLVSQILMPTMTKIF